MFEDKPTVGEMQTWNKRYRLSSYDACRVIDTLDDGEYWTVHPNESYNLCIDLNNLVEENRRLNNQLKTANDKVELLQHENEQLKIKLIDLEKEKGDVN